MEINELIRDLPDLEIVTVIQANSTETSSEILLTKVSQHCSRETRSHWHREMELQKSYFHDGFRNPFSSFVSMIFLGHRYRETRPVVLRPLL